MKKFCLFFCIFVLLPSLTGYSDSSEISNIQSQTILVQESCCPCNSGGRLKAIPKNQESSYYNRLDKQCRKNFGACATVSYCEDWAKQCKASVCSERVLGALAALASN